jgi:SnoaL-like domain
MQPIVELIKQGLARSDARDIDGFLAGQAPDVVWETPAGVLHGREEVRAFVEPFHAACPDGRHEIVHAYTTDDDAVVFVEGRWSGTHTGPLATPLGEIPPTGRSVTLPFAFVASRKPGTDLAGRVAVYEDMLGFMAQLGVMGEPAAA